MIIGIGTDMVSLARLKKQLAQFSQPVLDRLFTPAEQARAGQKKCETAQLGFYAKRFAAKEAFAKALGTGIGRAVSWTEVEVVNDDNGAPVLKVYGKAMDQVLDLIPVGCAPRFHVSLTDEKLFAAAFVIIEAIPADPDN